MPTQRELLRDLMLVAGKFGLWLTLRELAQLTRYGEASISAQLRHLRKRQYGGFVVEKKWREGGNACGADRGGMWEYKLSRANGRIGRLSSGLKDGLLHGSSLFRGEASRKARTGLRAGQPLHCKKVSAATMVRG